MPILSFFVLPAACAMLITAHCIVGMRRDLGKETWAKLCLRQGGSQRTWIFGALCPWQTGMNLGQVAICNEWNNKRQL